ncbi:hypothetical protein [Streptomyces sp. NPDC014733]|uniref:hypothetical protein n=1 Tax=Streptomyces sp. NPDC014733 TaxID=3364885 RepID=UPI00370108E6
MSISGDSGRPYGPPQPNPYGGSVPAPSNPYAQPSPQPGGFGPAAPVPAPDGGGKGASGWIWAIGGAVAASALWGSLLFATGGFSSEPSPDLAGYAYTSDLCADTSLKPFEEGRYRPSQNDSTSGSNPEHSGSQQPSVDSMWCNITLQQDGGSSSDYSSASVYTTAVLHKKSDPAPEFADTYRAYEKQSSPSNRYKVTPVEGLGDEAYLVTREDQNSDTGRYAILAVRHGWTTYQTTWSSYASGRSVGNQPTPDDVGDMLKTSARETLAKLRG